MNWKLKEADASKVKEFVRRLHVSEAMAHILVSREIDCDTAETLLNNPTDLFNVEEDICGMNDVAEALLKLEGRDVHIFADYDVDGLCSGFILNDFLHILDVSSRVYYPAREEGYGLSVSWTKKILKESNADNLTVVCVDNGISAYEPIELLKEAGAQVIVIDHHEPPDKGNLVKADALCDAWIDEGYGTHLCAAAVVWKVITRMAMDCFDEGEAVQDTALAYLPYVALATISDVMPAVDENRAIVQAGLRAMNHGDSTIVSTLMNIEGIEQMRTKDIAWTIAPELNACSRMKNTALAARFFAQEGIEGAKVKALGAEIRDLNKKRKTLTDNAFNDIMERYDFSNDIVCFADASDCPIGLVGILAGKITEATGKPAIVYHRHGDTGSGSARAPQGVSIKDIVNYEAQKGNAVCAMGHAEACGVTIYPDKIAAFNEDLRKALAADILTITVTAGEDEEEIEETGDIDAVITPDDMTYETRTEINSFGYTSQEVPELGILNVGVEPIPWITSSGKRHILFAMKTKKERTRYAVKWNGYDDYVAMGSPKRMNFAGTLDNGSFCRWCKDASLNEHSTMLTIDHMEPAESGED